MAPCSPLTIKVVNGSIIVMSVKSDGSGRRSLELEFEVPGTPEQVWQAIATGPGISSWLFPTEVEEREGGAVAFHIGPGMESTGTVTAWEPPHRFAYEEPEWCPNAPPLATEFVVEARSGGTCVVRLVHSLFGSSDEWDDQIDGVESGWPAFFRVLRLYLTHFFGQRCSGIRVMGKAGGTESDAWDALSAALGLTGAAKGQRRSASGAGFPPIAGIVERVGEGTYVHELTLLLDEPAPGVALVGAYTWGGHVHTAISFYLFGERGTEAVARYESKWRMWMDAQFPAEPVSAGSTN